MRLRRLAVAALLVACNRTPAPEAASPQAEIDAKYPRIAFAQNGATFDLGLPGWAPAGYDKEADVAVFARGSLRMLVQLRRFRRIEGGDQEAAADRALQAFCPQQPCKIGLIKPGYWLSHYDGKDESGTVLNWDLAAFPNDDHVVLAIVKLYGADDGTHKAIERALKERFQLGLDPDRK